VERAWLLSVCFCNYRSHNPEAKISKSPTPKTPDLMAYGDDNEDYAPSESDDGNDDDSDEDYEAEEEEATKKRKVAATATVKLSEATNAIKKRKTTATATVAAPVKKRIRKVCLKVGCNTQFSGCKIHKGMCRGHSSQWKKVCSNETSSLSLEVFLATEEQGNEESLFVVGLLSQA
jgi:hypothetical protein